MSQVCLDSLFLKGVIFVSMHFWYGKISSSNDLAKILFQCGPGLHTSVKPMSF